MPDLASLRLQIVPLDQILLHEAHDDQRVRRLIRALNQERILRNPIMVTEYAGRYIQLDGATRAMAFREMGIPHIAVQIVDYRDPEICLGSWNHVLIDYPFGDLCAEVAEIEDLQVSEIQPDDLAPALETRLTTSIAAHGGPSEDTAQPAPIYAAQRDEQPTATHSPLFGMISRQGEAALVESAGGSEQQLQQITQVVSLYRAKAEVRRSAEFNLPALLSQHPDLTAAVVYPPLQPEDVYRCATGANKLPMGVTRHLVGGRALGLGVPLEVLTEEKPLEAKNDWLNNMVLERIREHKVRVYQEAVIIFDD